jgi:hypothetical protein
MKKRIITLLLLCSTVSLACADELQLQANHPERYVVVKGDTLWGISAKFLKDPWRWPQIWKMNREQIKNPHWIYPGDVVVLDTSNGQPELRLLRETVTLEPGVIAEPLEQAAIPAISPSVISPFLSQPLVIETKQLEESPEIVAAPDGRLVLGAGYRAYVSAINEGDGMTWQIYRPGEALVDPETKQTLGHEAVYLGDAKVVRYGEPATVAITRSKEEITVKDKLVPAPEKLLGSFIPHAPDSEIDGRIMTSYGGVAEISRNSIVTLNRGNEDGLEEGHVLAVYSHGEKIVNKKKQVDPRDHIPEVNLDIQKGEGGKRIVNLAKDDEDAKFLKLPDERIGLVMVFRTFDHVAYALVMQSERPIHLNDAVRTP